MMAGPVLLRLPRKPGQPCMLLEEIPDKGRQRRVRPSVHHLLRSQRPGIVMEPLMDKVNDDFLGHILIRYVDTHKECDFEENYSSDLHGIVTFSTYTKFGFVEKKGCNFDGTLAIADISPLAIALSAARCPEWTTGWTRTQSSAWGSLYISNIINIAVEKITARLKREDEIFWEDRPDFSQYFHH
ncbi:hypothetical protein B0T13DRAFT_16429 [Neurospora crassa]|nr:hypothetical protein B0T13DRAFT_16429 [Neurospora crassa]